ncbi:acetyltransferase, GNAT family protein [Roseobacter sp. MED193]|uniref:GNAT family N-acetyltransferase n=1 Tax=Roseobacter sp. MED193 TaxID=314262 RepID=UPI000068C0E3|nr:GNAT family N-acetyltransferase [Roseobacter sp. MED193]EAQ46727.1 acetyltransferase, GNAT family protein [Roseobacter sp. MED193]
MSTTLTDPKYYAVVEATWPTAAKRQLGSITLREGQGGGSRVSAASVEGSATEAEIETAEQAMRAMGQDCLFMIRDGQDDLDAQLGARGYLVKDPVNLWVCPIEKLMDVEIPRVTTFALWSPLEIQREIWIAGGIGMARQAIMERVSGPKAALLGRYDDKPAGAGFVAVHDGVAMVHALEILPHQRRRGMGVWMMRQAAFWAAENGATEMAVLCTKENAGANGLYASLGMTNGGQYHYRQLPSGA